MDIFVKDWAFLTLVGGLFITLISFIGLLILYKKAIKIDLIYYVLILGGLAIAFISSKLPF